MLISFSEPEMLPYLNAGVRQARGEDVAGERVKRQTIRRLGTRAETLLAHDPICHTIPYSLHLWWKSRTADRLHIGDVERARVYKINILNSHVEYPDGRIEPCFRIDGSRGWREGDSVLFWAPGEEPRGFVAETYADGFSSPEAFCSYFVPNRGDRFDGVIFKW